MYQRPMKFLETPLKNKHMILFDKNKNLTKAIIKLTKARHIHTIQKDRKKKLI